MSEVLIHKFTAKCPKCKYTSKIPYDTGPFARINNKNSVHSKKCPIHRLDLVKVPTSKGKLKAKFYPYRYYNKKRSIWKVKQKIQDGTN